MSALRNLSVRIRPENFSQIDAARLLEFFDLVEFISMEQIWGTDQRIRAILHVNHTLPLSKYQEVPALQIIQILKEVDGSSIIIGDLGGSFAKKLASLGGVWFTQPSEVTPEHILITLRGLKSEILDTFRILRDMSVTSEIRMFEEFNTDTDAISLAEKRSLVIETALNLGYYEFPRKCTQRDIAKELNLKQSTISEHLQKAESLIIHSWSSKKSS
tara:strand:+ start:43 stop:690 length:648 start_codon:yes stop_codon:yes gene_type:complete